jgi:hypothetical protein
MEDNHDETDEELNRYTMKCIVEMERVLSLYACNTSLGDNATVTTRNATGLSPSLIPIVPKTKSSNRNPIRKPNEMQSQDT